MKKSIYLLILFIVTSFSWLSGQKHEMSSHEHVSNDSENPCFSADALEQLKVVLSANRKELSKDPNSHYSKSRSLMIPKFQWPVKQAPGFDKHGYYYITNYVDLDPTPGILDYNGGSKSYNSHNGLDILIVPHQWNKMYGNEVWAIAAAPGIVMALDDGYQEQSCETSDNPPDWNYISIEHSDGTVSTYGHQRTGSIPQLPIGTTVNTGDYLGIIGSSGNSTDPHLHFMILDPNGDLVEPFKGQFNNIPESYWENQHLYEKNGILDLTTHGIDITINPCPFADDLNLQDVFYRSDSVNFSIYLKNTKPIQSIKIETFYQGDESNSPVLSYSFAIESGLNLRRYSLNEIINPSDYAAGRWTVKATLFNSILEIDSYSKEFWIIDSCPDNLTLAGLQLNATRFADQWIESTQLLLSSPDVRYRAGDHIILKPGFFAQSNSKFQAKVDFQCPN